MPVISTNIAANSAVRYLNINSADQTSSLSKLASGSRITQASDDAAGLAISTRISSDVTALTQAATNASHGISVLQTADGGASNISDILQRMKSLASQSSSGTVTDTERVYIDAEFQSLVEEVDGIASSVRYNGESLLDGTSDFATGVSVMVGSDSSDTITLTLSDLSASTLGLTGTAATLTGTSNADITVDSGETISFDLTVDGGTAQTITMTATGTSISMQDVAAAINAQATGATASLDDDGNLVIASETTGTDSSIALGNFTEDDTTTTDITGASDLGMASASATGTDEKLSVATQADAEAAIAALDDAIDTVSAARAEIGALESRFAFRSEAIATSIENLESANSAITDTDVASESAKLASAKVKTQAAVAAAAQANQMPQDLLKLLQ
jgi:flagellin